MHSNVVNNVNSISAKIISSLFHYVFAFVWQCIGFDGLSLFDKGIWWGGSEAFIFIFLP